MISINKFFKIFFYNIVVLLLLIIFLETFFCVLRVFLDRPFVGWMMHRPLMEAINDPCQRQVTHPILGHVHDHRNNCEIKNGFAVGEYVYYGKEEDQKDKKFILTLGGSTTDGFFDFYTN